MRLSRRIRTDRHYSARGTYRHARLCGLSRKDAIAIILFRYGWARYPRPTGFAGLLSLVA